MTRGLNQATQLADTLRTDPRVAAIDLERADGYRLITVVPAAPMDSPVTRPRSSNTYAPTRSPSLRNGGPQILVGGATAKFLDLGAVTRAGAPPCWPSSLVTSFLFLLMVFRSVALAVKAVVMNLLTTAAAVGLTVAVFQWGWLSHILDFTSVGYLQVYMPVSIFAVVFGLSMDYQVFLIRRIREEWLNTGDNTEAVTDGIAHTADRSPPLPPSWSASSAASSPATSWK